jgi:hypothetical protein
MLVILDSDGRSEMMKIFLVSSLFLVLCIDVAGADDPYAEGEIIFRAVPGAIEVGPDFECTILDQDLAAITGV